MRSLKVCLWLMAVLGLSGLLLMFCYVPSAAPPASSAPSAGMSLGYVLRGIHFWAANLVILAVLVHSVRTVFVKTNRSRAGGAVALVLLTCLLCFTGYLLPWDQLAFWMQRSLLPNISAWDALLTVYWTHTLVLSLLTLAFLRVYVRRTRRDPAQSA